MNKATLLSLFTHLFSSNTKSKFSTPSQNELSGNEFVIENLKQYGDSLIKPRKVNHWIYFKNELDRQNFIELIKKDGFTIEEESFNNDLDETPFILHISGTNKVDLHNANKFTALIESKAKKYNGDYDGWETSIEK
ncbi:ribonuclease E inhibitor RraB [Flavobacterium alkalisoli]|uniref:ribonuclease E inhibitor RraB n=1 Tax=Flavobacterium alkalisoli TaxID=2602769 RepID=UPI003A8CBEF5